MKMERTITQYPEVVEVLSRIGRPEAGSHPHPVNYAEIYIELKPLQNWDSHRNKADLIEEFGEEQGTAVFENYASAFTPGYMDDFEDGNIAQYWTLLNPSNGNFNEVNGNITIDDTGSNDWGTVNNAKANV